jgi:hypothetical protein
MRKIFWVIIFGISMALVEAAIVVYLRAIYYPAGFSFPLVKIGESHLIIEIGREAATILMLISVAALSGKKFWEKFSYFLICFGIWDIFYYIWLKIAIGWPSSIFDWDILFLIPLPWIGPVIATLTIAIMMIFAGLFIIIFYKREYEFQPSLPSWVLTIAGTLIILYSFMRDAGAGLYQHLPLPYKYEILIAGEIFYILAFLFAWKNTVNKSGSKRSNN